MHTAVKVIILKQIIKIVTYLSVITHGKPPFIKLVFLFYMFPKCIFFHIFNVFFFLIDLVNVVISSIKDFL